MKNEKFFLPKVLLKGLSIMSMSVIALHCIKKKGAHQQFYYWAPKFLTPALRSLRSGLPISYTSANITTFFQPSLTMSLCYLVMLSPHQPLLLQSRLLLISDHPHLLLSLWSGYIATGHLQMVPFDGRSAGQSVSR